MDLFEALYTTRAMRRMQARDVSDELIPRLLDAAVRAPSGGGFQNWCFIVIRDHVMKAWLGTLFEGDIKAARVGRYKPLEDALARGERSERLDAHAAFVQSMLHLATHCAEIQLLVAALIQSGENALWPGGSIYPVVWSLQLAARAHGLGSVPVGSLARHQAEIFPRLACRTTMVGCWRASWRWGIRSGAGASRLEKRRMR